MKDGIVGVEEFAAINKAMATNAAEKFREALLSLLDRGEAIDI